MKLNKSFGLAVLMVAVLALAVPQLAQAVGTDFGTTITNNVTIQYGSGPSTITTNASVDFLVDRVLDWTIAPSTAPTVGVFPGSTGNAIAYSVQNATNGTVDILLSLSVPASALSAVALYYDDGATAGSYDAGDTPLPTSGSDFYLDEVAEDTAPTILIVLDVPSTATSADFYDFVITATPREAAGSTGALGAVLDDHALDNEDSAVLQNVYNDGAGYSDGAPDGTYTAYAPFQVALASLSATKTAEVTDDGLGNVAPLAKAIPGATVHYIITVTNNGTATATGVRIEDTLPAELSYVLNSWNVTAGGGGAYVEDQSGDPLLVVTGAEINGSGAFMTVEYDAIIN